MHTAHNLLCFVVVKNRAIILISFTVTLLLVAELDHNEDIIPAFYPYFGETKTRIRSLQ